MHQNTVNDPIIKELHSDKLKASNFKYRGSFSPVNSLLK